MRHSTVAPSTGTPSELHLPADQHDLVKLTVSPPSLHADESVKSTVAPSVATSTTTSTTSTTSEPKRAKVCFNRLSGMIPDLKGSRQGLSRGQCADACMSEWSCLAFQYMYNRNGDCYLITNWDEMMRFVETTQVQCQCELSMKSFQCDGKNTTPFSATSPSSLETSSVKPFTSAEVISSSTSHKTSPAASTPVSNNPVSSVSSTSSVRSTSPSSKHVTMTTEPVISHSVSEKKTKETTTVPGTISDVTSDSMETAVSEQTTSSAPNSGTNTVSESNSVSSSKPASYSTQPVSTATEMILSTVATSTRDITVDQKTSSLTVSTEAAYSSTAPLETSSSPQVSVETSPTAESSAASDTYSPSTVTKTLPEKDTTTMLPKTEDETSVSTKSVLPTSTESITRTTSMMITLDSKSDSVTFEQSNPITSITATTAPKSSSSTFSDLPETTTREAPLTTETADTSTPSLTVATDAEKTTQVISNTQVFSTTPEKVPTTVVSVTSTSAESEQTESGANTRPEMSPSAQQTQSQESTTATTREPTDSTPSQEPTTVSTVESTVSMTQSQAPTRASTIELTDSMTPNKESTTVSTVEPTDSMTPSQESTTTSMREPTTSMTLSQESTTVSTTEPTDLMTPSSRIPTDSMTADTKLPTQSTPDATELSSAIASGPIDSSTAGDGGSTGSTTSAKERETESTSAAVTTEKSSTSSERSGLSTMSTTANTGIITTAKSESSPTYMTEDITDVTGEILIPTTTLQATGISTEQTTTSIGISESTHGPISGPTEASTRQTSVPVTTQHTTMQESVPVTTQHTTRQESVPVTTQHMTVSSSGATTQGATQGETEVSTGHESTVGTTEQQTTSPSFTMSISSASDTSIRRVSSTPSASQQPDTSSRILSTSLSVSTSTESDQPGETTTEGPPSSSTKSHTDTTVFTEQLDTTTISGTTIKVTESPVVRTTQATNSTIPPVSTTPMTSSSSPATSATSRATVSTEDQLFRYRLTFKLMRDFTPALLNPQSTQYRALYDEIWGKLTVATAHEPDITSVTVHEFRAGSIECDASILTRTASLSWYKMKDKVYATIAVAMETGKLQLDLVPGSMRLDGEMIACFESRQGYVRGLMNPVSDISLEECKSRCRHDTYCAGLDYVVNSTDCYLAMDRDIEEGWEYSRDCECRHFRKNLKCVPALPAACPAEVTRGVKGRLIWPVTESGSTAIVQCPTPGKTTNVATRTCKLVSSGGGVWLEPDAAGCGNQTERSKELERLSEVTVTNDNVAVISSQLADLTNEPSELGAYDITNAATVFTSIMTTPGLHVNPESAFKLINSVSDLLNVDMESLMMSEKDAGSASSIVMYIEGLALMLETNSNHDNFVAPNLAVSSVQLDPGVQGDLKLSSKAGMNQSNLQETDIQLSAEGVDDSEATVSIELPKETLQLAARQLTGDMARVQFTVYQNDHFFQVMADNRTLTTSGQLAPPTNTSLTMLNSKVISARVGNLSLYDLQHPVVLSFKHAYAQAESPRCVFWDFAVNGGSGGWSERGCSVTSEVGSEITRCSCNHLTNFALLMDVYGTGHKIDEGNKLALSIVSYVGCGISLSALTLALLTYLYHKKLRKDNPSKLLIQLSTALFFMLITFLFCTFPFVRSNDIACKVVAGLMHYFLLASFTWMAVQAFYMYLALVKVFQTYYAKFILKCCLVGWGVPVLIVVLTVAISRESYGNIGGEICWLTTYAFFAAAVAPIVLILMLNFLAFVMVIKQLRQMAGRKLDKTKQITTMSQLRGAFSVMILLGLTWTFAIFAIDDASLVFQYLFAIFNSLQGLFIFVFYCAMKPEVQRTWMRILPCCPTPDTTTTRSGTRGGTASTPVGSGTKKKFSLSLSWNQRKGSLNPAQQKKEEFVSVERLNSDIYSTAL